jgi:hypothetical protein
MGAGSDRQIVTLVTASQDALGAAASARVEAGLAYRPRPEFSLQVDLSAAEIPASADLLGAVLGLAFSWRGA